MRAILTAIPICLIGLSIPYYVDFTKEATPAEISEVFEGTSSCDPYANKFLRIPVDERCDFVKWRITFNYNPQTKKPSLYSLSREYSYYVDNQRWKKQGSESLYGNWEIVKGIKGNPDATIYQLRNENTTLNFVKIDGNLIHLLSPQKEFLPGMFSHSFTLSKTGGTLQSVSRLLPVSAPMSTTQTDSVLIYEAKTPCSEIAKEKKIPVDKNCFKLKWLLKLYFRPGTLEPSGFSMSRTYHRQKLITGNWKIVRTADKNRSIIYQLHPEVSEKSIELLRADDNVLFFLRENGQPFIGNSEFSYTFNRRR